MGVSPDEQARGGPWDEDVIARMEAESAERRRPVWWAWAARRRSLLGLVLLVVGAMATVALALAPVPLNVSGLAVMSASLVLLWPDL